MQKATLIFLLITFLSTYSCRQGAKSDTYEGSSPTQIALKSKYFTEHTAGYIGVKDGFIFRINNDFSDSHRKVVNGVKILPHVDGNWSWLNDNTIQFLPDEPLGYGEDYRVLLRMDELLESNEHPSEVIQFSIHTRDLRFTKDIHGLKINSGSGGDELSIEATISSTDYVDPELVESIISIEQSGGNPEMEWEHTSSGQKHLLTISNISQDDQKETSLKITWNGTKWDKNFRGEEVISIKPKEYFSMTDIRISSSPDRTIRAFFSRPLLRNQDLSGLISMNGSSEGIKSSIEGNVLYIYPTPIEGEFDLALSDKILSSDRQRLDSDVHESLRFDYMKPAVRRVGSGVIIPNTSKSYMPIEIVNLKSLDIEIFKIYRNNVLQYLQSNDLEGNYSLSQVGKIVHRAKLDIEELEEVNNHNKWIRVGVNLKDYIQEDPASIYQIRIGYQPSYAITDCEDSFDEVVFARSGEESMITYSDDYYENWEYRDNPCNTAYYNPERVIKQNLILSDVGAIVKQGGQNRYHISINSISTGQSINNATVSFYDYQQQLIMEGNTNGSGFLTVKTESDPSFLVVSHSLGFAYVKLNDQNSNSLTDFDIGGVQVKDGMDGFIYADRGVHRPGDTLFVNFMLDDSDSPLPLNHPVTLDVKDSKGNKKFEQTTSDHIERIYAFTVPTEVNALTGQWRATIKVGANHFTKSLRIETIKPNRLKIELDAPEEMYYSIKEERELSLKSRWLHGASANGLNARVEASYLNINPDFKDYKEFIFMDPARQGNQGLVNIFDGKLNESGNAEVNLKFRPEVFPGKVKTNIKSRVFENSGNFSEHFSSFKVSPFENYVGIKSPENKWGYKSVKIGENSTFQIVSLDQKGKVAPNRKLSVGIYNINWRWWYYQGERYNIYRLNSAQHKEAFYTKNVITTNEGSLDLKVDFQDVEYGRKLIRVCDEESGHCTGEFFYAEGWGGSNIEDERESLAKLKFTSDKENYKVGDEVTVSIPTERGSRILLSLETGGDVIFKEWVEGNEGSTDYKFTVSPEMSPNIYVHAIMVQSYDQKDNDLPLRMYGVIPIKVTDDQTKLNPQIEIADKLEPKEEFKLTISEENNKPMAYTIAVVDEGLLDLTNFSTPDPHSHFFAKQSLGVKTWDLFEYVMTGINGSVDRIITVGGDGDGEGAGSAKKAIRFKPVVMTKGPFYIHNGETRDHTFTMPNYIGSVRVMVIAKQERAYGHTDKAIPVKKDIMVLPTMPRVLGPDEIVTIPVSVFANEDHIRNVDVGINMTDNLEIISPENQQVKFSKAGEKVVYFKAKVKKDLGIAKVKVSASSGNVNVDQELELDIRNPNPFESRVYDRVIEPGEKWETTFEMVGMKGTNEGLVEMSAVPPMNLESRLEYLTSYPYGCVEQTVSSAFPQLSLDKLIDLDSEYEKRIEKNVNAAIRRISILQRSNGGMAYWPGTDNVSEWGTSYAGHFLNRAKGQGYYVSSDMLSSWESYQSKMARSFRIDRSRKRWFQRWQMLDQAYRLYTLAIQGSPELPSMNVLRKEIDLPSIAKYLLAAAYAHSGKIQVALDLIKDTTSDIPPYQELAYSYGSDLRDMALIAQTLMILEKDQEAGTVIRKISQNLNSNRWYNTQTLSHALLAVSDYVGDFERDDMKFNFKIASSGDQSVEYRKPIYLYSFDPDDSESNNASIQNNSNDVLFARITMKGQKAPSDLLNIDSYNRNISLDISYTDLNGSAIDPSELVRGTDFVAHVSVVNQNTRGETLEEMALAQIFPSGWEIQSGGLNDIGDVLREDSYEYRDTRDDRVYTFFDLGKKKEFKIMLTAAYDGEYFLPPISCEAMYDNKIQAKTKGVKVKVVAPVE
jgi:uncharacterized protein YfaS (alpha-2-macroglobulin family)